MSLSLLKNLHCNALESALERQLQLNIYALSVHREATEMQTVNKMAHVPTISPRLPLVTDNIGTNL